MSERTPFNYRFGLDEGRLEPVGFTPQDGEYVFVLGSEAEHVHQFRTQDKVEIYQDLDLTGIKLLRLDAGVKEPINLAVLRDVSGHYEGLPPVWTRTATLKFQEVLFRGHATLRAGSTQPYAITGGCTLRIVIDAGVTQTITFIGGISLTASQVAAAINSVLTGGVASAGGSADDPYLQIASVSQGRTASVEVLGGSAYPVFRFPLGTLDRLISGTASDSLNVSGAAHLENGAFSFDDLGRVLQVSGSEYPNNLNYIIDAVSGPKDVTLVPNPPVTQSGSFMNFAKHDGVYACGVAWGGDELSGIIAPDGDFSETDVGLPIRVSGASHPGNNFVNFIDSVQSKTLALLRYSIVSEPVGFDAAILGALWRASVLVDDVVCFSMTGERGKTLLTNDIAVNVSKLTGTHKVGYRLDLIASST